jgi:hypothetical protein
MMATTFIREIDVFVCLQPPEQLFSYLAAFTITCDRAANLDLYLALKAFSSEGSLRATLAVGPSRSYLKYQ